MEKAVYITKDKPETEDMDYSLLREKGIEQVQKLAGKIWTDYNEHDPGVTILEQLCYALTDLGYRTSFDIEDILYAKRPFFREMPNNAFYDASEIFPCNPTSNTDYRILIIDKVQYIKNAYVYPVRDNPQGIRGLYRVMLQVDDDLAEEEESSVIEEVRALMLSHRNLGEDLDTIEILQKEYISFSADIDIAPDAIGEELFASIFFELENYITPPVRYYNLSELQEEGKSLEDIFQGPLPDHGFIRPGELLPLTTEIYVSKLIEIISEIKGITRIRNFVIYKNGIRVEGDVITMEKNHFPVLHSPLDKSISDTDFPINFFRGKVNYNMDLNTANQIHYAFAAKYKSGYQVKLIHDPKKVSPKLLQSELNSYYSIQRLFPKTYGIGEYGVPAHSNLERRALAKQLKGYLLFFEQLLSNYLAQLANFSKLFSLDETVDRTYFLQVPDDIPDLEEIIGDEKSYVEGLDRICRKLDPFVNRRNRFLDHLLARFGETFDTDFLIKFNAYSEGLDIELRERFEHDLIDAKIKILRNYGDLSKNRGLGFDYSKPSLENENVSTIAKRVCLFLNFEDFKSHSLIKALDPDIQGEFAYDDDHLDELQKTPSLQPEEERFTILSVQAKKPETKEKGEAEGDETIDQKSPLPDDIDENLDYKEGFIFSSSSDNVLKELLRYGMQSRYFLILRPSKRRKIWEVIFHSPETGERLKVYEATSQQEAKESLDELIQYLKRVNSESEGFHIVEHILLRRAASEKYGFNLLDDHNDILLSSYQFADQGEQRIITDDLLITGVKKENYIIREEKGLFSILLKDDEENLIGQVTEISDSREKALKKIEDIIDYLNSLKRGSTAIYSKVEFFTEHKRDLLIHDDFYSNRISILLPSWPVRFQNADFRELFQKFLAENAPAHLVFDFYWLGPEDLAVFEDAYFKWLEEKSKESPNSSFLDNLSFNLIDLLQAYKKN